MACTRVLHTQAGDRVREQLLELSDHAYRVVYSILESHVGVSDYEATLQLRPVTDGNGCFAEWSARFNCAPEAEGALRQGIGQDVFIAGLRALGAHAAKA